MLVAIKQRKKLKKQIEEYKLLVKDYLTYLEEVESGKNPLKKVVHDKDLSKKLIQNQIEQVILIIHLFSSATAAHD